MYQHFFLKKEKKRKEKDWNTHVEVACTIILNTDSLAKKGSICAP